MTEDLDDCISDFANFINQQPLESSIEIEGNTNSINDFIDTFDSSPRPIFKRLPELIRFFGIEEDRQVIQSVPEN